MIIDVGITLCGTAAVRLKPQLKGKLLCLAVLQKEIEHRNIITHHFFNKHICVAEVNLQNIQENLNRLHAARHQTMFCLHTFCEQE